jgi:hypothetical protein
MYASGSEKKIIHEKKKHCNEPLVSVVGSRDCLLVRVQRLKKSRCEPLGWLHFDAAKLLEI